MPKGPPPPSASLNAISTVPHRASPLKIGTRTCVGVETSSPGGAFQWKLWSPASTMSVPSGLRTAAERMSGSWATSSRVDAWIVARSCRWAASEQLMATASHNWPRPRILAAVASGIRPSACAASSTLSVSAATPVLRRIVAECLFRFMAFPTLRRRPRQQAKSDHTRSLHHLPERLFPVAALPAAVAPRVLVVLTLLLLFLPHQDLRPVLQDRQRVQSPPQRHRRQQARQQRGAAQRPDDVADRNGDERVPDGLDRHRLVGPA